MLVISLFYARVSKLMAFCLALMLSVILSGAGYSIPFSLFMGVLTHFAIDFMIAFAIAAVSGEGKPAYSYVTLGVFKEHKTFDEWLNYFNVSRVNYSGVSNNVIEAAFDHSDKPFLFVSEYNDIVKKFRGRTHITVLTRDQFFDLLFEVDASSTALKELYFAYSWTQK